VERPVERPLPVAADHDIAPAAAGQGVELANRDMRATRPGPLGHNPDGNAKFIQEVKQWAGGR
jgi:hypothetical protein